MHLSNLIIKNHPILKDIELKLVNDKTGKPYSVVAFVGENGCGKTTLLNEIFNYNNSEYIQNKQEVYDIIPRPFNAIYLRQGSLHKNAMKEVRKLIDGQDMYPTNSASFDGGDNPFGLRSNNAVNEINKGLHILEKLGDDSITTIFKNNNIGEVYCSTDVSKRIDGKEHGYNITDYSSGQQEILLKLKDLKNMAAGTDCVLLDEPETSLHPRWQKEIVDLIKEMVTDANGNIPQIFLATHSEKVLQSLIANEDALIIRLYKENNKINHETIGQMQLLLPKPTFAELDYVIFKIDSFEYCSELYDLLEWRKPNLKERALDTLIRNSEFYDESIHSKDWFNERFNDVSSHNIATYCRNFFHHPKDREEPTPKQLHDAIILLRNVVSNLK